MSYGQGEYGQRGFGGSSFETGGPTLVSSDPINGATGVSPVATITFTLSSTAGLDVFLLNVDVDGEQAIVGGVFQAGYSGTIVQDPETDMVVTISGHPPLPGGATPVDIDITDLAGQQANLGFSYDTVDAVLLPESVTVSESLVFGEAPYLPESLTLSEGLGVSKASTLTIQIAHTLLEEVETGSFLVVATDANTLLATFGQELRFENTGDLSNYLISPVTEGANVRILSVQPNYEVFQTGSSARVVDLDYREYASPGEPPNFQGQHGFSSNVLDFHGTAVLGPEHVGDYIKILNGQSPGVYQITDVYTTNELAPPGQQVTRVVVDRPVAIEDDSGYVWGIATVSNFGGGQMDLQLPGVTSLDGLQEILFVEDRTEGGAIVVPGFEVTMIGPLITILDHNTFTVKFSGDFSPTSANNRIFVVARISPKVQWQHISGVQGLTFKTTKFTGGTTYLFEAQDLFTKVVRDPITISATFQVLTNVVQKPRVLGAEYIVAEGSLLVEYDQPMLVDDTTLTFPGDYAVTGPSTVVVKRVRHRTPTTVGLDLTGLKTAGEYTLTVSTSTPKDIAGNPLDPTFNTVIFTAAVPEVTRSVFTDKGPIAKPPLTLQTGTGAILDTYSEVTLPGALLTSSFIGYYVTLSGGSLNGGTFRIASVLSTTRVRLANTSFTLPDASSGSLDWEVFNPREGLIADDPADVTVRVNGSPVTPEAVIGLLGQVVLDVAPAENDSVEIDYSWCCNPTVEIRRLNSKEFRLNSVRDLGFVKDKSQHKYRYNNVLIRPSDYDPDDMLATLDQPELRELHYRAYERAYTPVLNDPSLLLLNSPIHRIAYPPAQRTLTESFVAYEGVGLPEALVTDPWTRVGAGTAASGAGLLTITDDSTGEYPTGQPVFWRRTIDVTFPHVFAMSWRFSLDTVTTPEGVFTGVAAGYSDDLVAVVVGYLDDGGTKKIGFLKRGAGNSPEAITDWTGGIDAFDNPTGAPIEFDWSILRSYRIFRDTGGNISLFVDGEVDPRLRVTASELPFLEELTGPFDEIQGAFFGSLSRPAESVSTWDFVRYLITPTNPQQFAASSFVNYEANVVPEADVKPWTPVGYHGTATILSGDFLTLSSTSATDAATASDVGLVGGDYRGFVRMEPLLTQSSEVVYDAEVQLLTHTHGVSPYGLAMAVDDGTQLMQLAFFPDRATPKFSYGGRSFPEDFVPFSWQASGGETALMKGRTLRIEDTAVGDGKVYFHDDTEPASLTAATGIFSGTALNFNDGDTVIIDGKVYTFQLVLTNVDGNVQIGVDAAASLSNFSNAVNLGAGSGTAYAAATTLHPTVSATGLTATSLTVTAKSAGPLGNSIGVSDTVTDFAWDDATLSGGSTGESRVVHSTIDYILEFRCRVESYTVDGSNYAGAFAQVYDSARSVGLLFEEDGGTKYVAFHADGVVLGPGDRFAFDFADGEFHTYRFTKSTAGDLVSLFIDGVFVGSTAYSNFAAPPVDPIGQVSFGSSTPASVGSLSVVEWAYVNAWRLRDDLKHYVGLWKGSDDDSLLGYHLPLKASGTGAQVAGNGLGDANADFLAASVMAGDKIIVDVGANRGVYEVAGVGSSTSLTIVGVWPSAPSLVDYRIAKETDWTSLHKYRIARDSNGEVAVLLDADPEPIIRIGYNSLNLPVSGVGVIKTLADGLPAMAFGSFDAEELASSSWDYVRYGLVKDSNQLRAAPHHQVLNQWNVMHSPERLFTVLPHTLTDFKSSSTGQVPKTDPDFLEDPGLEAFTKLNQGTPLVPQTQSFEVRAPFPIEIFTSALNQPEDVLNDPASFVINDSTKQYKLLVPDDVLYSCLDIIEQSTGEQDLITPFDDSCNPNISKLTYQKEVCLEYTGDDLPENDTAAPTLWELVSDNPANVVASSFGGILTYGTTGAGTRTVYRNNSPLPDHPSLQSEARFRLKVLNDASLGVGETQIKFGLSAPGMTVALTFLTSALGERFVLVLDQNNGNILGSATFDFLDGNYHDYRLVRDPGQGVVRVFIDS